MRKSMQPESCVSPNVIPSAGSPNASAASPFAVGTVLATV